MDNDCENPNLGSLNKNPFQQSTLAACTHSGQHHFSKAVSAKRSSPCPGPSQGGLRGAPLGIHMLCWGQIQH